LANAAGAASSPLHEAGASSGVPLTPRAANVRHLISLPPRAPQHRVSLRDPANIRAACKIQHAARRMLALKRMVLFYTTMARLVGSSCGTSPSRASVPNQVRNQELSVWVKAGVEGHSHIASPDAGFRGRAFAGSPSGRPAQGLPPQASSLSRARWLQQPQHRVAPKRAQFGRTNSNRAAPKNLAAGPRITTNAPDGTSIGMRPAEPLGTRTGSPTSSRVLSLEQARMLGLGGRVGLGTASSTPMHTHLHERPLRMAAADQATLVSPTRMSDVSPRAAAADAEAVVLLQQQQEQQPQKQVPRCKLPRPASAHNRSPLRDGQPRLRPASALAIVHRSAAIRSAPALPTTAWAAVAAMPYDPALAVQCLHAEMASSGPAAHDGGVYQPSMHYTPGQRSASTTWQLQAWDRAASWREGTRPTNPKPEHQAARGAAVHHRYSAPELCTEIDRRRAWAGAGGGGGAFGLTAVSLSRPREVSRRSAGRALAD